MSQSDQPLIPGLKPGASPLVPPVKPPVASEPDASLPVIDADREPWNANWIRVLARRREAAVAAGLDPDDPAALVPLDDEEDAEPDEDDEPVDENPDEE